MIDLRSDTLTLPEKRMIDNIDIRKLGDDGRDDCFSRGEDSLVNELENLAAKLTGKEAALFFPTGTMANHAALLSFCKRGDSLAIDPTMHMYISEKIAFDDDYFGMEPAFYELNSRKQPDIDSLRELVKTRSLGLICIENTHNFGGGICLSSEEIRKIRNMVGDEIPIYMDGARIFNAAVSLHTSVEMLCENVDAVSFCLSKGLGAPIGSLLCGNKEMVLKARRIRKLLGGTMRQAGVAAAAGLIALEEANIKRLEDDHSNARILKEGIAGNEYIHLDTPSVQTNIVTFELDHPAYDAAALIEVLKERGVRVKKILRNSIRMTTYKGISQKDVEKAVEIINETLANY